MEFYFMKNSLKNTLFLLFLIGFLFNNCFCEDKNVTFNHLYEYKTLSPLGIPQQVIVVNGMFPGPPIEVTTNEYVVVNVKNHLDEDLSVNWKGMHLQDDPFQDGVPGTNCAIRPRWPFQYKFQAKDQIGSFFYHPSINFQRASGGFGPIILNNRSVIPLPFPTPDADVNLMIGDWYIRDHKALRTDLDAGKELGMPDGVLINGKGPYRYNNSVPDGIEYTTINVEPGKTYRFRVHNIGISTSLNFKIQNHNLNLAETEGYYTSQMNFTNFDIHVGQSYSFLVSTDQNASTDYYIVASARFVNQSEWQRVTGVAILKYSNSKGNPSGPLPDPPNDQYDQRWSLNQATNVRQNTTASGARPNPQGSFHYGDINVTNTYILQTLPPKTVNGTRRATLNGISFVNPKTPILLADLKGVKGEYKTDFPSEPMVGRVSRMDTSIINGTFKGFVELVFQNNDTVVQTFHLDGFSFYVVGMDYGVWSVDKRGNYNKWDAIFRCTVQVYPGAWTAVYAYLDNPGVWNLRTENLDRWYLGQETYIKLVNPEHKASLSPVPDNVLYCGALAHLQKDLSSAPLIKENMKLLFSVLTVLVVALIELW